LSARLSDERLLAAGLPEDWKPLLELIGDLDRVRREARRAGGARGGARAVELAAEAGRIHDRLVALAPRLAEDLPGTMSPDSGEHRLWFTQAVLLWMHFAETGGVRLDTVLSGTLSRFPVDLQPTGSDRARIRNALCAAFGWTAAELSEIEHDLDGLMSNLRVKTALTGAIAERFAADRAGDEEATRTGVDPRPLALMRRFYGETPLRPGDVGLVVTRAALYFCVPHRGRRLLAPDARTRPCAERRLIADFLTRLEESNTARTDRFPAFGYLDRGSLDPDLVRDLTCALRPLPGLDGLRESAAAETLASMVMVLPTQLVEQYLIHDCWGHGWQESLCEFEWLYRKLPRAGERLGPATGPYFGGDGTRTLAEAFSAFGGRTVLDCDLLRDVLVRDLRGRVTTGLNAILSEILADVIEHKFVRRAHPSRTAFPSSSLLPDRPLKLDLTLSDARAHIACWRRPYRRLARSRAERRRLARRLELAGLPRKGLARAVRGAARLVRRELSPLLSRSLEVAGGGDRPPSILQRIMLNAVALDAEIERYLDEADAELSLMQDGGASRPPLWQHPAACLDLLVLVLAWFYEQDRPRNVWHLDELVRDSLRTTVHRFTGELRRQGAPGSGR
jgi:hypothetical protein